MRFEYHHPAADGRGAVHGRLRRIHQQRYPAVQGPVGADVQDRRGVRPVSGDYALHRLHHRAAVRPADPGLRSLDRVRASGLHRGQNAVGGAARRGGRRTPGGSLRVDEPAGHGGGHQHRRHGGGGVPGGDAPHRDVGREFWLSAVLRRYRGGDLRHLRRGCENRVQNGRHVRPQGGNRWGRGAHRHRRENPARAFAGGMRAGDGGFSGNTSKKYGG